MKIDCNITQNFMREFARMCKYMPNCRRCDMNLAGEYGSVCYEDCMSTLQCERYMPDIQEIVQNWSDNHHQKTYLEDFKEKYPNAPISPGTMPCPSNFGWINMCDINIKTDCEDCWNQTIQ